MNRQLEFLHQYLGDLAVINKSKYIQSCPKYEAIQYGDFPELKEKLEKRAKKEIPFMVAETLGM